MKASEFLEQIPGKDLEDWDEAFCAQFERVVAQVKSMERITANATRWYHVKEKSPHAPGQYIGWIDDRMVLAYYFGPLAQHPWSYTNLEYWTYVMPPNQVMSECR